MSPKAELFVHSPKTKQFFGGDKGAALAAAWRNREEWHDAF